MDGESCRLVFQWESVRSVIVEPNWRDLLAEHWEALAVHKDQMALDVDYQRVVALYDSGMFRCWTARCNGLLVGYIAFFIQPHLHYRKTLTAVEDLFMLSAPYRKGTNGVRLFTTAIDALREVGVKRVILHTKKHFQAERGGLDKLFTRLGFEATDIIYSRML
jgi:GNAT superfamily N-acetyltransferase